MHAFSDAIREFGIHSVRILPAKALFHVGSLEIMHAVRFLPWGSGEHGRRVGMSASRNASAGRNVGWRQAHLWISPFFRMACWAL